MNNEAGNHALPPFANLPRRSWLQWMGRSLCAVALVGGLAVWLQLLPPSIVPVIFAMGGTAVVLLMVRNRSWLTLLCGVVSSLAGAALAELWLPGDREIRAITGHIVGAVFGVCLARLFIKAPSALPPRAFGQQDHEGGARLRRMNPTAEHNAP